MKRCFWCTCCVAALFLSTGLAAAQEIQADPGTEVLHTTTQLVVLDATVFDGKGHVVTAPLGKDDFLIEEDRKLQAIRYFEAPAQHEPTTRGNNKEEPLQLIAVLDELNFGYNPGKTNAANMEDLAGNLAFMRGQLVRYLQGQTAQMHQPMELLALTHHGFLVLSAPTRDRDALLNRVKRRDPGLGSPFRDYEEETGDGYSAAGTLTKDSIQAIWSLALQERSVPGRKIVLWLGRGGPDQGASNIITKTRNLSPRERYNREIADLLVDARITLDVFRTDIHSAGDPEIDGLTGDIGQITQAQLALGNAQGIGFTGFVHATGGALERGNDVQGELNQAVYEESSYYTLSYAPTGHDFDGQFRRIKVTVKGHPDWVVLTKAGYYALQYGGAKDFEHQLQSDMTIAAYEAMPFSAIGATVEHVDRVQGTEEKGGVTVHFVLSLDSDDLQWHTDAEANVREAEVAVAVAALGSSPDALASKGGTWKLRTRANVTPEAQVKTRVTLEIHLPPKTQRVRFVVRDIANGRIGTTEIPMKAVQTAGEVEAQGPTLGGRKATP